jgi:ferredoxin
MSQQQPGLSRRALLGLFRRPRAPEAPAAQVPAALTAPADTQPPAFSLEAFYANRARSGEATLDGRIPAFSLREGPRDVAPRPGTPREAPVLGATVRVRTQLCLAWQGTFCTTCVEQCPVEGAILLELGRPHVVPERCNGCGTCVRMCPAPLNAFELRPAEAPGVPS